MKTKRLGTRRSKTHYWALEVQYARSGRWETNYLAFGTESETHTWALRVSEHGLWQDWRVVKTKRIGTHCCFVSEEEREGDMSRLQKVI